MSLPPGFDKSTTLTKPDSNEGASFFRTELAFASNDEPLPEMKIRCVSNYNLRKSAWQSSGFTLIELLIVVAIAAGLAGLLFPLIGKMRANASNTGCVNNLRQLTAAAFVYTADNNGDLPRPTETVGGVLAWPDSLATYLGKERPFVTELSAKTCPTQYALSNQSRTFGINRQLDGNRQGLSPDTPAKLTVMTRSGGKSSQLSTIPYFMDGVFNNNWMVYRSWAQNALNEKNFPHNGHCNMSFLDGHIEATSPGLGPWSTVQPRFDDGQPAF